MSNIDLVEAERRSFRSATDTGLWDLRVAALASMFAIVPFWSATLGDFWSALAYVPVLLVVFGVLRWVRERHVRPRVGVARFGAYRRGRLRRYTVVMLVVNVIALVAGAVAAVRFDSGPTWLYPFAFGLSLLVMFSAAAYYLEIPRFFVYGLLLIGGSLVGEELFRQGQVTHHGYPVVFGSSAVLIATVGLIRLGSILRRALPSAAGHAPELDDV
jgi:hypothetical protein